MTDQLLFPGMEAARPLTDSLFFAVVPDAPTPTRIGAITHELRDKYALTGKPLAERLHISLHGIGEFPSFPKDIAALAIEAAASVALPPFEITFDRVMSFSGKAGQLPLVLLGEGTEVLRHCSKRSAARWPKRDSPGGNPRRTSPCFMTRAASTSSRSIQSGGPCASLCLSTACSVRRDTFRLANGRCAADLMRNRNLKRFWDGRGPLLQP